MQGGRGHHGLSLLLRAHRQASCGGSEVLADLSWRAIVEAYAADPGLAPAASTIRTGSLLTFEPPGPGARTKDADRGVAATVAQAASPHLRCRYEPWLAGRHVPRVDCSSSSGFERALGLISQRTPVVLVGLDLLPASRRWTVDYLRRHTTEWPGMHVLRSPGAENRYLYYHGDRTDRDMSAHEAAPRHASQDLRTSFAGFLRACSEHPSQRHYLQAPLVVRAPSRTEGGPEVETWSKGIDATLKDDCQGDRRSRERLRDIAAAGDFGFWSRSQLFVGPSDSLSPVHYDQYDNIFLQVAGSKHFLLFDPLAAEGLYPFPVAHPYDEYAMVDLQQIDDSAFPRARQALEGRGAAATLEPGEVLYIPTHWWHHVQGGASEAPGPSGGPVGGTFGPKTAESPLCISVNFWFEMSFLRPAFPLPIHLELELARHVEFLLADNCGSIAIRSLAAAMVAEARGDDATSPTEFLEVASAVGGPARQALNFVFFGLARVIGPGSVLPFLEEHFPAERYDPARVTRALAARRLHSD